MTVKRKGRFLKQRGLQFYAKIKYLDGKVTSRRSSIKRKITTFLPHDSNEIKWIYIKVAYKPNMINEGKYLAKDFDEMWKAWNCFTEEDLIKDVINNY